MRTAAGIALFVLALAAAVVPSGHCITLLLAGGDPDCCCTVAPTESSGENSGGCGCLAHRKACCYVLSSSICNHDDAGMDNSAAVSPTLIAIIPAASHASTPALARADDVSPPGGPPLFIFHASLLI